MLVEVLAISLATLFMVSGAAKLGSRAGLTRALNGLFGISVNTARRLAIAISIIEVTTAILLALGRLRLGATLSVMIGLGIILTSGFALWTHRKISCGCFGSGSQRPIGLLNLVAGATIAFSSVVLLVLMPYGGNTSIASEAVRTAAVCASSLMLAFVYARMQIRIAFTNFRTQGA
jgi:hypothetical protein